MEKHADSDGIEASDFESRYFRHESESRLGAGTAWVEFGSDGWATRQVECYDGRWFCSIEEYFDELGGTLCDQPMSELDLSDSEEITKPEFETAWKTAIDYLGRS
ncbi:MAG: hypothetical protein R3C19_18830 [Planctomycetaceae bacterium]